MKSSNILYHNSYFKKKVRSQNEPQNGLGQENTPLDALYLY